MKTIRLNVEAESRTGYLPRPARLTRTARTVFSSEPRRVRSLDSSLRRRLLVNVMFCSDDTIRRLNRRWFGKNRDTDVISFNFNEIRPEGFFLGEIFISSGQVVRQARKAGHAPDDEADLLLIHGCLHLLGFDHTLPGRRGALMRTRQERLFRMVR
jgi:rRNA maturation RNase YbeY